MALLAMASVAVASGTAWTPGVSAASVGTGDLHSIKHVVMIVQENRSFDGYFGTFPGADGIAMGPAGPTACLPHATGSGCVSPYHDPSDVNLQGPHGAPDTIADVDGGLMDGFQRNAESATSACVDPADPKCRLPGTVDVMGYHDAREIPNYWAYAQNFVLQDRMFAANPGWSLATHEGLVSGWAASCTSADPMSCTTSATGGMAPPDYTHTAKDPEYAWTDLTHLLHKNNVSWKYYVTAGDEPDCRNPSAVLCAPISQNARTPGIWNPLPWFSDVKANGQLGNVQSTSQLYADAAAGTLPAVSWVAPSAAVSEHAPSRVSDGQAYTTSLINALMSGPDWDSTAVFLTWDDWAGQYDHVRPPVIDSLGYGLRVPGLVISPYAKMGYIDHQTLSFDAYLKFIEDDFLNGQRLDPAVDGRPDARPNVRENIPALGDLTADFDFTQPPRPPLLLPIRPWDPPTLTALSAVSGPTAGGQIVTINGGGFTSDTQVWLDGTLLPRGRTTFVDAATVRVTLPPHVAATVQVNVTTRGGAATASLPYSYEAPVPAINSVAPAVGNVNGGYQLTVRGTGLFGATAADLGGVPVTIAAASDTAVVLNVPAGAPGTVTVHVTTAGGTTAPTTAALFTYSTAPLVTSVSPARGTPAGGTAVTVRGAGFTGATAVTFSGSAAATFTVISDTQITVTTPTHAEGLTGISVVTPTGSSPTAAMGTWFTFAYPPTVVSVNPRMGPIAGGQNVIITGTHLTGATRVQFGSGNAASFTVNSDTQITARTAAQSPGWWVDAVVSTPKGTSARGVADWYRFVAPPVINNAAPTSLVTGTPNSITVNGAALKTTTAVALGGTAVRFTVTSDAQLTATLPAHLAGTDNLTVTTPGGSATTTVTFTAPVPTLTALDPSGGNANGGYPVTLVGTGLFGATAVDIGGVAAPVTASTDTALTLTMPAGVVGPAFVHVTTPGGTTAEGAGAQFTYSLAPTITTASPARGPSAGGTTIVVTGAGFTGTTAVLFDTTPAATFTVTSDTQLTVVTPVHPDGPAVVSVSNPAGTNLPAAGATFTFAPPPPTVVSTSPRVGPSAGGQTLVITGTGFSGASRVRIGGTDVTSFTVDSATQITVVTPAHAPSWWVDVVVTTAGGTTAPVMGDWYRFIAPPTITAATPATISTTGATIVVTGTALSYTQTITIGTLTPTFHVDSDTQITIAAPSQPTGAYPITITTPAGTASTPLTYQ